jgi:small subunit ribosomal protein S17
MATTTGATETVQQTKRKTKVGRVVSDKMDKTIVVSVERLARHPVYKRVIRLTTKFKAHDEDNDAHVGDTVLIEESRPLSATKRWRLVSVQARAGEHGHGDPSDIVSEEAEVSEAIHGAAHPGRQRDDAVTTAASDETPEGVADAAGLTDATDAGATATEAAADAAVETGEEGGRA